MAARFGVSTSDSGETKSRVSAGSDRFAVSSEDLKGTVAAGFDVEAVNSGELKGTVAATSEISEINSGETRGAVAADSDVSTTNSGVAGPVVVSIPASLAVPPASDFGGNGLPHSGQKLARTRIVTPQEGQRRAISGSGIGGISNWGFRFADFTCRLRDLRIIHCPLQVILFG